ncbi:helicase domain protein [Ignisphaera aggregans DSM 17230]|uniref:Helicase domain protein n=1 Tax=Ignisphaera aggregans (strain DSM 17230 / JCM 13409 / AQ1.S1) TaxID=583356 RepID=E0ST81_IGNAA|nr:helicase domain protein [Ignisphaera aggregans DSM 17230]
MTREQALQLFSKVIRGFDYHPFFFILNCKADPPALPFAHQVELLFKLAFRRPIRILIGDEIGLGKTIEAILIAKMLEKRDGARKILILVPRILVEQWRSELKRFGVLAKVIERKVIDAYHRQGFPDGWYLASIDLVKREPHKSKILGVDWDIVIVDEAHRVGKTRSGQRSATQRYELVEELAKVANRNVILLSATPHRGYVADYISRLRLVDPYLIGGEKELDNESFYSLTRDAIVVRRTKMDINDVYEHRLIFKNARFIARVVKATPEEEKFNELLFEFLRDKLLEYHEYVGEEPKALPLLLALIAKRASSSPYAAMKTLERIISKRAMVVKGRAPSLDVAKLDEEARSIADALLGLGFEDYSDIYDEEEKNPDEIINRFAEECAPLINDRDVEIIRTLVSYANSIVGRGDSRLRTVFRVIEEHVLRGEKVVVFTEYRDTAEYIYRQLSIEMPDIAKEAALITGERIEIPGWRERRNPDIEDLKKYLGQGRIKVVISTDVASEGLNLQVANIIINYEPTWSPIKIEQRLGRVWRLGQERDVTSYTIFLDIRSDKDVLDILYKKLLALGRSLQESKVPIGEEVVIDMMTEEGHITIPIDTEKGVPKYSEYKALLTYIREGRIGLESYIKSIISALESLKKSLERIGLARKGLTIRIERILRDILGDFRGNEVERVFKDLFIVIVSLRKLNVKIDGNRIYVDTSKLDNIYDIYDNINSLLPNTDNKPVYLLSSAQLEGLKELHLFRVMVFFRDRPIYSEVIGVGVKNNDREFIRGRKLFEIITVASSQNNIVSAIQEYSIPNEFLESLKISASKIVLRSVVSEALKEFREYISRVEGLGFSAYHQYWEPRPNNLDLYSDKMEYLGAIIFTTPSEAAQGAIPTPVMVKEIEEKAMKIAMEYEIKSGRIPEDVSMREHFDIFSRDPRTGEIRFIEVKGKSGLDLEVELTEAEFNVAREKGDKYWLYIVYGIGTKSPRILAIQDPVNNMRWREVSVKRYRFRPEGTGG